MKVRVRYRTDTRMLSFALLLMQPALDCLYAYILYVDTGWWRGLLKRLFDVICVIHVRRRVFFLLMLTIIIFRELELISSLLRIFAFVGMAYAFVGCTQRYFYQLNDIHCFPPQKILLLKHIQGVRENVWNLSDSGRKWKDNAAHSYKNMSYRPSLPRYEPLKDAAWYRFLLNNYQSTLYNFLNILGDEQC